MISNKGRAEQEQHFNPEMVRLAREAAGLTQGELAAELGVTQSKVSKVEAGLLEYSPEEMSRLCRVLHRPRSFFFWPDRVYGFASHELFHRKRQAATAKSLSAIHATMNIRRMQLARLLRSADVVGVGFPRIDPDEYNGDVAQIARTVRAMWHVPTGPIRNVTEMVEDAGGMVVPHDFGTQLVDAVSQWVPELPPLLFVNSEVPADRMRWNLCHEVGHLIMHRIPSVDAETEANRFAAELLMPAEEIRHELYDVSLERLAALKPYWRVSMQALLHRAQELETLSPRQARRMWAYLSKLGYRKHEPIELDPEPPTLYRDIFTFHREQLNYEITDLEELLAEERANAFWTKPDGHLSVVA